MRHLTLALLSGYATCHRLADSLIRLAPPVKGAFCYHNTYSFPVSSLGPAHRLHNHLLSSRHLFYTMLGCVFLTNGITGACRSKTLRWALAQQLASVMH
jgi:hypothetical protein